MSALQSPSSVAQRVVIERTEQYGGGWQVRWAGAVHGGTHRRRPDAALHARELRESERWDYDIWCEAHGVGVA